MDSDKEPESNKNSAAIISKIKDGSLDASTLIQVNATIMIGVIFFVSVTSALPSQAAGIAAIAVILGSVAIIFPFAVSAILIIIQKRASRIAWGFTAFGFALLFLGLFYIAGFAFNTIFNPALPEEITISSECAKNLSAYGIDENYRWQCSMFTSGSLAEVCAIRPERFNMELSECWKFIPPSNESGG